jgi:hypothetical protein
VIHHRILLLATLLSVALFVSTSEAVVLTSVDQLDLTNVVKAYDFTTSANSTVNIGGVTFTSHNWTDQLAYDGLTVTDINGLSGAALGAPVITMGGTVTDQTNLTSVLSTTNFSLGSSPGASMTFSIAVPDGDYIVQYLAGTSANRSNELIDAGPPAVSLGTFNGSGNFLISGTANATGGTGLTLRVDYFAGSDGRPIISGLILSEILPPPPAPEPSTLLLLGCGMLVTASRIRRSRGSAGRWRSKPAESHF